MKDTNFSPIPIRSRISWAVSLCLMLLLVGTVTVVSAAEGVPELSLAGPITPGEAVPCTNTSDIIFYKGSTVVYSDDGLMQVFKPDGTEQFTAHERNASRMNTPEGGTLPVTRIFNVSSVSVIDPVDSQNLTITDNGFQNTILIIREGTGVSVQPVRISGIYYLGTGGLVAAQAGNIMILTPAIKKQVNQSVVRFMRNDFGPGIGMGIICNGESRDLSCAGLASVNGTEEYPQNQRLDFAVLPAAGEDRPSAQLTAYARASLDGETLNYEVGDLSSPPQPQMSLWCGLYRSLGEGSELVESPTYNVICADVPQCIGYGSYTPNRSGTYYIQGFQKFTLSNSIVGEDNPQDYYIQPSSAMFTVNVSGPDNNTVKTYLADKAGIKRVSHYVHPSV